MIVILLYMMIVMDIGGFCFLNVMVQVFVFVVELVCVGVDFEIVLFWVYEFLFIVMLCFFFVMLELFEFYVEGCVVIVEFNFDMFECVGVWKEDFEGLIDYLCFIVGVDVVVFF